ncbi:hypothetical protein MTO96_031782, partial [Rhipicephalus appendiculatus]
MKMKFHFTCCQERPLLVGFEAESQRCVKLQDGARTPSLQEMIPDIAGATADGLVNQGSVT